MANTTTHNFYIIKTVFKSWAIRVVFIRAMFRPSLDQLESVVENEFRGLYSCDNTSYANGHYKTNLALLFMNLHEQIL